MEDQTRRTEIATKEELLSHWSIQESLLQSYRGLFISSQSIIFSVAALIVTAEAKTPENGIINIASFLTLLVIGILLLKYWVDICRARELDVSYCQLAILKIEKENETQVVNFMTEFKIWQTLPEIKKKEILSNTQLSESQTRKRLSRHLPILFLGLWVISTVLLVIKNCLIE
jgi:hypothetical protein